MNAAERPELMRVLAPQGTFTDNAVLRADGNDGIQGSVVTMNDSGSLDGIVNLTTSGNMAVGANATITGDISINGQLDGGGSKLEVGDDLDFQSAHSLLNLTTGSGGAIRDALGFAIARKTADETITASTTMQDDDDLALAVAANELVLITMAATFTSPAAADIKVGFTFPAGGTLHLVGVSGRANAAAMNGNVYMSTSGEEQSITTTNAKSTLIMQGIYRGGGTAGTLQFRWAQNTSDAGNTTFHAESAMWKMRYA